MKYPFNMLCRRWLLILNESCLPACCEKVAAVCPTQSSTKFESIICCIVAAVININCHGTRASFLEQIPNQSSACVFLFAFNPLLIMYSFLALLSLSLFSFFLHGCSRPDLACLVVYSLVLAFKRGEITRQLPQGLSRFEIDRPQVSYKWGFLKQKGFLWGKNNCTRCPITYFFFIVGIKGACFSQINSYELKHVLVIW